MSSSNNEKELWYVYLHTNKNNGKMYCGITGRTPKERWENGKGYKKSVHFYNAIKKYGWNNFEHNILYKCSCKEYAEQLEKFIINKLELTTRTKGYNLREGGGCAGKLTQETKEKIRLKHLGKKADEETRKKISKRFTGSNNARAILTEQDVLEIRKTRFQCIMTKSEAFEIFKNKGITMSAFSDIWVYREWPHVGQEYNTEEVNKWHKTHGKAQGEKAASSKLNHTQVNNLKLEFICGASITFLQKKYKITEANIYRILKGRSYKNVRPDLNIKIKYIQDNKFTLEDVIYNLCLHGLSRLEISHLLNVSNRTIICCISNKNKKHII